MPRQGTIDDAYAIGRIAYAIVDLDPKRAEEEVRTILSAPLALSTVVVQGLAKETQKIVAVMNGVLLRPWFSEQLLERNTPYFHIQVREAEKSPFPNLPEIAAANAGEGLDLFLAHLSVDIGLEDVDATRVRTALLNAFVEQYAGNRIRSILVETVGWENSATAIQAGFEVLTTYPEWRAANGVLERDGPHLLQITLERAMQIQNFHSARMLQYRPPTIRFPQGAQELLRFAMRGYSDTEIASLPGFTETSVASAWTRILTRAKGALPDLFRSSPSGGKSKDRLALLAYLRQYPEELWPYG